MCSPSFAPSKFTIICLPYKFLRVWKCLLTEEKFHTHLACTKLTEAPATPAEMLQKCTGYSRTAASPLLCHVQTNQ